MVYATYTHYLCGRRSEWIMYTCHNCDGAVSKDFVRVFGDDRGRVHGCPDCTPRSGLVS